MELDINEILAEMLQAIKDELTDDWEDIRKTGSKFLENRKERLSLIAELRLNGEFDQEQFELRLNQEKRIAEAEFHAIAVISKAKAQRAANAAIEVLQRAVQTAINAAIP